MGLGRKTSSVNIKGVNRVLRLIVRFVVSALVLLVVSAITPGFAVAGFWSAIWASVAIAVIGWVAHAVLGPKASPSARGVTGFIISAAVIWLAQFFVPGLHVSIIGALLAALVIGLVEAFVPLPLR